MTNKPNLADQLFETAPATETVAPTPESTITVAVGLPGKQKPFTVPTGSTVQDVLLKAGMNPEGMEARVDGNPVRDLNTPLRDGQMVMLHRPIAGNS